MKLATLLVLVAVCGFALAQSSGGGSGSLQPDYVPVCDPQNYTRTPARPFPTLPNQFSTILEGNHPHSNLSIIIAEYYDDPGNRGRLDYVVSGSEQGETAIFDYNLEEAFLIPDFARGVPCGVQLLTQPSELVNDSFGITYVNGSVHIGSVKHLFDLPDNVSARYLGTEDVRGIPCNRWQTCHAHDDMSYTLDYYFVSAGEWDYIFPGETIPVQIVSSGSMNENGTLADFRSTYSFIGFHSGPSAVPDSVFEVPTGLPCLGRIAGKELPAVPPFFTMQFETLESPQKIGAMREFYDAGLFRLDFQYDNTPYTIIHDFELSVEYVIDRRRSNCSVVPLENATDFYDVVNDQDGSPSLRSPTDFFRLGSGYNFSYEGSTSVRGIPADAWISVRDSFSLSANTALQNGTVELFYSRPGWTSANLFSMTSEPIPLAVNLTGMLVNSTCENAALCGSKFSAFYNIFDFSSQEPDYDIFDTSFCTEPGQYRILSMIIPGQQSGSAISQLRRNIRLNITEWADIPKLQVASIEVVGENGTHIFVTLQILPLPNIAKFNSPRTPQDVLSEILNLTSPNDQLPFSITLPSGDTVRPFLLRVDPNCPEPSTTIAVTSAMTQTITTKPTNPTTKIASAMMTQTITTKPTNPTTKIASAMMTQTITTKPTNPTTKIASAMTQTITTKPTKPTNPTTKIDSTASNLSPTPTISNTATTATTQASECPKCPEPSTTITVTSAMTQTITIKPTNPTSTITSTTPNLTPTPTISNTATTANTQASECPKTTSSGSGGVSNGTVAGVAIAMFVVGMICALLAVLLIKCWRSRQKSFNLVKGDYKRQENEMEGFTD